MFSFIFAAEGWEPFTSGSFFHAWKKPNVDYPDQNLYIYKGKNDKIKKNLDKTILLLDYIF